MTQVKDKVFVKAVRSFMGEEGDKNWDSEPFEVSRQRAAELIANKLVVEFEGEDAPQPAGEEPEAKKAEEPLNKAIMSTPNKAEHRGARGTK